MEKCTDANIQEKCINAFCGLINEQIISKYYANYFAKSLRGQYDKVKSSLYLDLQ